MTWKGRWRNQYGSISRSPMTPTTRSSADFEQRWRTAGFYGQTIAMLGVHHGDCMSVASAGRTPAGDAVISYTGLLRNGKMETLWFVCADASSRRGWALALPTVPAAGE